MNSDMVSYLDGSWIYYLQNFFCLCRLGHSKNRFRRILRNYALKTRGMFELGKEPLAFNATMRIIFESLTSLTKLLGVEKK